MPESLTMHTSANDLALQRSWTAHLFAEPAALPFSFDLGERHINGIPAGWNPVQHNRRIDANLVETVFSGQDPLSGLQVRLEYFTYQDAAVVEWVVWLSNPGQEPSPMIANLQALDASFAGEAPELAHCNGDYYSFDGYTPQLSRLEPGQPLRFAPTGGRPCDGAFPYFRLCFAGCGFSLAIGWPGQWSASFSAQPGGVAIRAGQELTHLRLLPGETIRTPRMTLLAWQGDQQRAINLWRRWYRAHLLPRPNGQPLSPKLACCATEDGEEFTNATEENQVRLMRRAKAVGLDFDIWWIDAGWYPCRDEQGERHWVRTGSWQPDPERFPRGLAPVSASVQQLGANLLVWFEPERVFVGSQLDREHPDWLLKTRPKAGPPDENRLLDLGNPAARSWLSNHVCQLIQQSGIGVYRQDFNFPPLEYWRDNDAEDRQGMHENLHVQGYLRYWDDLLGKNPGLWIDSCSSGGRRNDLETMRRSVPLHFTDYGYGDHAVKLAFHRTLFEWIPFFKEATVSWDQLHPEEDRRFDNKVDSFSFHCALAGILFATVDIRREDYDFAAARRMIAIWRRAADGLLNGDYYPLTPFDKSGQSWVAWQFDQPEKGSGFFQAIRLPGSPADSLLLAAHGLDPSQTYHLENPENGESCECSGAELLRDGLRVTLPPRSGGVWFYQIVQPPIKF